MPSVFSILKDRGIVIFHSSGFFTVAEGRNVLDAYRAHPDFDVAHKHLLDLARVSSYEHAYLDMVALQARIVDIVVPEGHETLLVMYAPTKVARELAALIRKSWEGVSHVIPVIAETESDALDLLAQPERNIGEMFVTSEM